jgi:hypothetical protein
MTDGWRRCVPRAEETDSKLLPRRLPSTTPVCVRKAVSPAIVGLLRRTRRSPAVHSSLPKRAGSEQGVSLGPAAYVVTACFRRSVLKSSCWQGKRWQRKQLHSVDAAQA